MKQSQSSEASTLEELIQKGKQFGFHNNSHVFDGTKYGNCSIEFLAWIASVDDFIKRNYGEGSSPYKLFQTYDPKKLNGAFQTSFERQLSVIRASLEVCQNILPESKTKFIKEGDPSKWTIGEVLMKLTPASLWRTIAALIIVFGGSFSVGKYFGNSERNGEMIRALKTKDSILELNNRLIDSLKMKINQSVHTQEMTRAANEKIDGKVVIKSAPQNIEHNHVISGNGNNVGVNGDVNITNPAHPHLSEYSRKRIIREMEMKKKEYNVSSNEIVFTPNQTCNPVFCADLKLALQKWGYRIRGESMMMGGTSFPRNDTSVFIKTFNDDPTILEVIIGM